jgi:2-keto-4-pentenoate hydratase/2-oxohepta-3-ene-1,7-dioic acid hydratase in catechol pathway
MQTGNTRTMIFGVKEIVAYLSRFMTLHPGDLITTGTPPGVGMGQRPEPIYLKAGDEISLGIDKLGVQRQKVIDTPREAAISSAHHFSSYHPLS